MAESEPKQTLGLLTGEEGHLPWSHSKEDVAKTCMYKFHKIYMEGERETSDSLLIGTLAHETMEAVLLSSDKTKEYAASILKKVYEDHKNDTNAEACYLEVEKLLDYIVKFAVNFDKFLQDNGNLPFRVEHEYGLTEDCKRALYSSKAGYRTYVRGKVDLWTYNPKTKTLYVIDHKTNKTVDSAKRVHDNIQLNLYVTFITKVYNLDWEKAYFALNFLRKGKLVWSQTTPEENKVFTQMYFNTLHYLENKLWQCENELIWPREPSYKCHWCSFKNNCTGDGASES